MTEVVDQNETVESADPGHQIEPHVIVLFGATGDLAARKLLPGLLHLAMTGMMPDYRIVGSSTSTLTDEEFRHLARHACDQYSTDKISLLQWANFEKRLTFCSTSAGPEALAEAVESAEREIGGEPRRLHYLSVPPAADRSVIQLLSDAKLVERSRVVMEKPFGTDLASAVALNDMLHQVFDEDQIFRIDHFLGKEGVQNILAFRFANGLFEPIWNRDHIDHVQIDVPETLGVDDRVALLRGDRRLQGHGGHPPLPDPGLHGHGAADRARRRSDQRGEEQGLPLHAPARSWPRSCGGSTRATATSPAWRRTPTPRPSWRCKVEIDNWRWAGVPFFLRTGKKLGGGERIISIAFREPPKSMFPDDSGVGTQGPDHLTFDLADSSKLSLSFYGKKPGPGMKLEKLSLQFAPARDRRRTPTCSRPTSA